MCGIAGYVGVDPAGPIIMGALKLLEYRGYDSAGLALLNNEGRIGLLRSEGKLHKLAERLIHMPLAGTIGIGHIRWATHGSPVERNAHPHVCGQVAVVHNGIIENFIELKTQLEQRGAHFISETDTEVVPQLINHYLEKGMDPLTATRKAVSRLRGHFALGVMFAGREHFLIAVRKGPPLVIGFGPGGSCLASGELAIASVAERIVHLEDGDIAVVTRDGAEIYDQEGIPLERQPKTISKEELFVDKGSFKHFMLKEIHEQPAAIGDTLRKLADPQTHEIVMPQLPFDVKNVERLALIACGTASYAALVARYWFEGLAGLSCDWDIASEFRYRGAPFVRNTAGIFVSQSGETADTLEALRYMKENKLPTLAIVNVCESPLARTADGTICTSAGPEVSVASTKAFTTQLAVLACLAVDAARARGMLSRERELELITAFNELPARVHDVLVREHMFRELAGILANARDVFYVGRGTSQAIAFEGALKLKEISYIHAEAYSAGELKHGPLSLIDENVPVIVIAPRDQWFEKTASNLQEIAARGGKVLLLSDEEGCRTLGRYAWKCVPMPDVDPFVAPIVYAVAVQLLAYYTAVHKGTDVDQPRNLAKSVTVE